MQYQRLTQVDRYQIEVLVQSPISYREIARILNFDVSTISRELKRNSSATGLYDAKKADAQTSKRRENVGPRKKITGLLEKKVRKLLRKDWSPEQISGRLKLVKDTLISAETIYQYVYRDYRMNKSTLWQHLRRRRCRKKSHRTSQNFKNIGVRRDRAWIEERPKVVEERSRLGDLERDTVVGKKGGACLLTVVDRTSRLLRLRYSEKNTSANAHNATLSAIKDLEVKTITNDNGHEFEGHKETAKASGAKIFFCRPYSSHQRGTNENTNGLIRQYFPKKTFITPKNVKLAEDRLNNRPRKCLGFMTPLEVHQKLSAVALSG
jgi:IS30 family transposase